VKLSHRFPPASAVFDDPNLVSAAGLIPVVKLAQDAGLSSLTDQHLSVPGDKGAHAGRKVMSLVAGMVAGGDSIDDMAMLRHGAMGKVFDRPYAPSTLGSFLRAFTFGHVRQLDAVASRFVSALGASTPVATGIGGRVLVDIDDTIIEVHGYAKQGSGYGYCGVRGLNALLATATSDQGAPVIVAQRLRKGSCGSPRGAARLVTDALATLHKLRPPDTDGTTLPVLLRADSAFYGHASVAAAIRAGADVSVTVRLNPKVRAAIASIDPHAWTMIDYTDAIFEAATNTWTSRAEVAEIPYTAFGARKAAQQFRGRLVVRRIPDLNQADAGQGTLFDTWRFHAFFTTTDPELQDTVAADKTHRGHAIIEQVHADLKNSALAHLPSGKFTANAAWLVLAVIAFNLTRAAASTTSSHSLAKASTATIRRKLVTVPARIASSARALKLHLPTGWPWQDAWTELFTQTCGPPRTVTL
jgi:Transposase DDE domain group 1